ncbi:cupin domain-containing protein [Pelagibacterium limicola]|uniref:cupin domain-containing protein n=1 Tax=Pelagibacterium limicola TaxID=2791022 RepID=UPI0018AFB672|nr:cupin domain-containing protein [Pelagibacterium limicola]
MPHILRAADRQPGPSRTVKFEGAPFGANVSFFAVDADPGKGAPLHVHPYSEVWMVQSGTVRFRVGEETVMGTPGDIVVVEPNTPHGFINPGDAPLKMMCIHDADTIVQTNLEDAPC